MTEQTSEQTRLSISEAARWVGKTRRTLQRHIKDGKLSVNEDKQGRKYIDYVELGRVYPEDFKQPKTDDKVSKNEKKSQGDAGDSGFLPEKVTILEEQVRDLKQEREIARERETELLRIAKGLQEELKEQRILLLPSPENAKKQKKQGFWARAFAR